MSHDAIEDRRPDALFGVREPIEPPAEALILVRLPWREPMQLIANQKRDLGARAEREGGRLDRRLPGADDRDAHTREVAEPVSIRGRRDPIVVDRGERGAARERSDSDGDHDGSRDQITGSGSHVQSVAVLRDHVDVGVHMTRDVSLAEPIEIADEVRRGHRISLRGTGLALVFPDGSAIGRAGKGHVVPAAAQLHIRLHPSPRRHRRAEDHGAKADAVSRRGEAVRAGSDDRDIDTLHAEQL